MSIARVLWHLRFRKTAKRYAFYRYIKAIRKTAATADRTYLAAIDASIAFQRLGEAMKQCGVA